MILEPKKIKSDTFFIVSPSICPEVMGPDAVILVFGVSCHFLLKEIFPTQGSNPRLCISCFGKQVLYHSATWETQVLTRVHHNSSGWRGQGWGRSERVYSLFLLKIPKPADPKVFSLSCPQAHSQNPFSLSRALLPALPRDYLIPFCRRTSFPSFSFSMPLPVKKCPFLQRLPLPPLLGLHHPLTCLHFQFPSLHQHLLRSLQSG